MGLVTLSDVKAALGVSGSDQDAKITALLDPVSGLVERLAGRSFTQATHTEYDDGGGFHLFVSVRPIASITSITDRRSGDVIASSEYDFDADEGSIIRLPYGAIWDRAPDPSAFLDGNPTQERRRWKIVYVGGPATVPDDVKLAFYEIMSATLTSQGGKQSEKDGDYSYTMASGGPVPSSASMILKSYASGAAF